MRGLSDLDEAILRCYNKNSAEYLREAIACYRAGAYRSAIVTTWNCVFFDIMEKLRELSLSGDPVSSKQVADFEAATERGDVAKLLSMEKQILDVARTDLEFFGEVELLDLKRIQEDRNRCAHPSVNVSGEIFHPSPDLARSHIVHAIDHLLSFPPSHGKNALNRLLDDVRSDFFPTTVQKALEVLQHSPLARARKSLVRNFLIVLLKGVANDPDYKFTSRATCAIKAYAKINHQIFHETMRSEVTKIVRGLTDSEIDGALKILRIDALAWDGLAPDQRNRLVGFFENLRGYNLDSINDTCQIKELEEAANRCSMRLSVEDIRENLWFIVPPVIVDRLIHLYAVAHNFDQANIVAKTLIENVSDLTEANAVDIVRRGSENSQVTGSFDFPRLKNALLSRFPDSTDLRSALSNDLV